MKLEESQEENGQGRRKMIQTYRRRADAERYVREIEKAWPDVRAEVGIYEFQYAVYVTTPDGRRAPAGKRPRDYGKEPHNA